VNAFTRWLAIVIAVAGLAVAAALLIRELAMSLVDDAVWARPGWYARLLDEPSWRAAGLVGVVLIALSVVLLVTVVWMALPKRADDRHLELGVDDGCATLSCEALERLLARVVSAELGLEGRVRRARVERRDDRLVTCARVSLAPTDLPALQARLLARARDALGGATCLEVASFTLEVERLILPQKGAS
jgi:hypothetical protein